MATDHDAPRRVIDADGRTNDGESAADLDVADAYRWQVLARTFDERALSLQRQGRIGTYAPLAGQEAAQVGAAMALDAADACFPTYRDHAIYLSRGTPVRDAFLHLRGTGSYVDRLDDTNTFPPAIPIATQLPHAVGAAMAAEYRGSNRAVLASFGDGATSEGDFHEAVNQAGVFDAPVVFFCQNNGWAISIPFEDQTATDTIAEKADAYGVDGVRVDGNDVLAVYRAVRDALDRARAGGGPTLVEAVTYRRGAHTTADDPTRYRDEDAVPAWLRQDPLDRTRDYLRRHDGWTDEEDRRVRDWATDAVDAAVEAAEAHDADGVKALFEHVYDERPDRLADQRDEVALDPER